MKTVALFVVAFSCAAFSGGCSNPSTTTNPPAQSGPGGSGVDDPAAPPRVIAKGMSSDEIVRRIGKPTEVQAIDSPEGKAEVWIYRRNAGRTTQQTAPTMHQVPVVNPYTGLIRMVNEQTYSLDTVDLLESTSLLIYEGKLVEWKRAVEGKRAFHN